MSTLIDAPALVRRTSGGVGWWTDPAAANAGIVVAFSERGGGVSEPPYASLNLAAHVGDVPESVDTNRTRLMSALGLEHLRAALVVPEQVHGDHVARVGSAAAGSGALASGGAGPVPATDALICTEPGVPLMLCFADCMPVVLVAPGPAVAVVHAGWRGALASLPGRAARSLASACGCDPREIVAYVGPYIRACHYQVSDEVMSHFVNTFGTFARAESGGLDLGAVVEASLTEVGVAACSIASLGACTAEETDRFFSYRAEGGTTGRHCALVCIA